VKRLALVVISCGVGGAAFPEVAQPPPAVPGVVVVSPNRSFVPGSSVTITISPGGSLQYANLDAAGVVAEGLHNLTSISRIPGTTTPRFASATVGPGNVVPVVGVESQPVGTYFFYCTYHDTMRGTLEVR